MGFMNDMIKMTFRRIRQTTATSLFFIIGMTFSMLIVSVGISFVSEHMKGQQAKVDSLPPNGERFNLYLPLDQEKYFEYEKIPQFLKGLAPDSGVIFDHEMMHIDGAEANAVSPARIEWFSAGAVWHYPLAEGRYYTAEEIEKGEKVVLIGETLKKYTQEQNGKRYLAIEGETYEVVGRVGLSDQSSLWDHEIFMPFTALPEGSRQDFNGFSNIEFTLYNPNDMVDEESSKILENAKLLYPDVGIESFGPPVIGDAMDDVRNSQDQIFSIAFLGYFVSLIYAVNIVVFWIERRRYEIGVRKAFGYTNRAIMKLIFVEMMGLSLLAFLLAIFIQAIISIVVGRLSGYIFKLYFSNFIFGLLIVLLTTFVICIWPVCRALKIQPAEALKGGGGANA